MFSFDSSSRFLLTFHFLLKDTWTKWHLRNVLNKEYTSYKKVLEHKELINKRKLNPKILYLPIQKFYKCTINKRLKQSDTPVSRNIHGQLHGGER